MYEKITKEQFHQHLLVSRGHLEIPIKNIYIEDDLCNLDMRRMLFENVNFSKCNLAYSDLSHAKFHNCIFDGGSLNHAILEQATFINCSFKYTDLSLVKAKGARWDDCNLSHAIFHSSDLVCTIWDDSNLEQTNFYQAILERASFKYAINTDKASYIMPIACPQTGSFTAYKMATTIACDKVYIELEIPADAKRSSATTRKCRASAAKVIKFYDCYGHAIPETIAKYLKVISCYDRSFVYKIGEIVKPTRPFEDNRWDECASGIHFYLTLQEAMANIIFSRLRGKIIYKS